MLACPSVDWRRPDFVDAFNKIVHHEARLQGVLYVDNNKHILGPAWNGASDWCHPDEKVLSAILKHTLHVVGEEDKNIAEAEAIVVGLKVKYILLCTPTKRFVFLPVS